jgi:hypothetical protein
LHLSIVCILYKLQIRKRISLSLTFGHEFGQKSGNPLNWIRLPTESRKKKVSMNKFTQLLPFMQTLFDDPTTARKASAILAGILKARSPRLSEIAREMYGGEAAFVIGDPTEMPRPQAKKTEYVGTLSDGETKGYWLMVLAPPYHGRAIPCGFVDYSSRTINQDATSRNQHHFAAFGQVKELLGERPLVLDREFSYLELLENLATEGVNFVIRLKVGPNFCDGEGKPVALSVQ